MVAAQQPAAESGQKSNGVLDMLLDPCGHETGCLQQQDINLMSDNRASYEAKSTPAVVILGNTYLRNTSAALAIACSFG